MKESIKKLMTEMGDSGYLAIKQFLLQLWMKLQVDIDQRWRRTLPFGDYIVDRWKKAECLGFGEGSSIYDSSLVFGDVKVGKTLGLDLSPFLMGLAA